MEPKKSALYALLLALVGLLAIGIIVFLYFPYKPATTFDFGLHANKIKEIVSGYGLTLPDYSKSPFAEEIKISELKAFSLNAKDSESISSAKKAVESYKSELAKQEKTQELEAFEAYCDLVIETLNAAQLSFELERAGTFKAFEADLEKINDYNKLCQSNLESLSSEISSMQSFFLKLNDVANKAEKFSAYGAQAIKVGVSGEFVNGTKRTASLKNAFEEALPNLKEMCKNINAIETALKEGPFDKKDAICADVSKTSSKIDEVLALYKNVQKNAEDSYNIFAKYKIAKVSNFSTDNLLRTEREFRAYELVLETLKEQLSSVCAKP